MTLDTRIVFSFCKWLFFKGPGKWCGFLPLVFSKLPQSARYNGHLCHWMCGILCWPFSNQLSSRFSNQLSTGTRLTQGFPALSKPFNLLPHWVSTLRKCGLPPPSFSQSLAQDHTAEKALSWNLTSSLFLKSLNNQRNWSSASSDSRQLPLWACLWTPKDLLLTNCEGFGEPETSAMRWIHSSNMSDQFRVPRDQLPLSRL